MIEGFISPLAVIGEPPEHRDYRWKGHGEGLYVPPVISPTAIVEAFVTVDSGLERATSIGEKVMLMKHSHVGHDAIIGRLCNVAPGALIGGFCKIGAGAKIGMGAMIRPRITVGTQAIIGMGSVVIRDVPPGETWAGNPAVRIKNKEPITWTPDQEYDAWMEWWETWHSR